MAGYYLACSCGVQHVIEPRQAGETIACSCGRSIQVPTLVGLRKLPPVKDLRDDESPPRWSTLQAVIFTAGLLTALACLLFVGYAAVQWQSVQGTEPPELTGVVLRMVDPHATPDAPPEKKMKLVTVGPEIDALPPADLFEKWQALESVGLPPAGRPRYQVNREIARGWMFTMLGGVGAIVIAALVMSSAFLVAEKK